MRIHGFSLSLAATLTLCFGCGKEDDPPVPSTLGGSNASTYSATTDSASIVVIRVANNAWTADDQLLSIQLPNGVQAGDQVTVMLQARLAKPATCNLWFRLAGVMRYSAIGLPTDQDAVDVTNSLNYDLFPAVGGIQYFTRYGSFAVQESKAEAHVGVWLLPFASACAGSNVTADQVSLTVIRTR